MKTVRCIFRFLLISLLLSGECLFPAYAADTKATDKIQLTQAEQEFIKEHPVIYLGVDPTFVPYEFFDSDGKYKGIAGDYIELICIRTGLKMVVVTGLTWSEAYERAVNKEVDVLPCVAETRERGQYFLFSDTYYTFQRAVFINDSTKTIKSFEDLFGKTVAVQTNSSHHSYLSGYDKIGLSLYSTAEEALKAVSNGTETAFIGNLATSSYLIKSYGITNLKYFAIDTNATDKFQSLHFAVRNDWPELVGIINKGLASISQEEKNTINNKWISIEENVDYTGILRIVGIVGTVIALIMFVSFFWIVRLRREIAKRKKAQEELKAAKEEAEQANQVKSLFLARMSHEIRTPLSAIMGMAYLIKKTDVTVTQSLYLDKLTQAARNMLGIINDILDFSKIESGKIEIENISFDLDKVLQRIINITSVKVQEQGIEFTMHKDPNLPACFFGDPMRIEQILLNIVNNAVKFTEKGSVSLSVRTISKSDQIYHIEFCVKDTGIGMSKEQTERLFVPFDQGDSSISRRFGGSGLGLSIVKNLTDLMGGEVEVCSVKNEGSAFYIRLPLPADLSKEQTDTKKMAADCFRNIRALVLDKSENSGALLMECFHSFGIAADLAASEDNALRLMRKAEEDTKPYNLLVVDFMTPEEGGVAFLKKIKRLSVFEAASKYILMIPMTKEDLFEELEAAGIDLGITKPVIPSVLYNGIIEIYQINPPEPQAIAKKPDALFASSPYHILLVEDNKTNQFIAQSILEQAGFRVSKADNGEEGVRFFADNRKDLDLILMDIHMPGMDGYAASDLIRGIDADMPIVAMTADAIAGVQEKCKCHGIGHYVSKPFEPDQFIETILEVLQHRVKVETPGREKADDDNKPVLDTADGIKRIGGDSKIYHLILQEFYNENRSVAAALKEKIDAEDYSDAVQIVHKMKSSSGNIGAKSLYEAASMLQKSLQAENEAEILNWHEKFRTLLYKLLAEIENI